MAITQAQYLQHFRAMVLAAAPRLADDLVRGVIAYGKRGADEREAAERALKEIYASDGRPHDAHLLKHWLQARGAGADAREIA